MAYCGAGDEALRLLRDAVEHNYCSYPAMDKEPLFDLIRHRPEFAAARSAGIACQKNFLAQR